MHIFIPIFLAVLLALSASGSLTGIALIDISIRVAIFATIIVAQVWAHNDVRKQEAKKATAERQAFKVIS